MEELSDGDIWAAVEASIFSVNPQTLFWRRAVKGLARSTVETLLVTGDGLFAGGWDFGLQHSTDFGRTWSSLGLEHQLISCSLWTRGGDLLVCGESHVLHWDPASGWQPYGWFDGGPSNLPTTVGTSTVTQQHQSRHQELNLHTHQRERRHKETPPHQ